MINTGDTAFMMICAALVFIMTPGLAFFYGGLVSRKNVLTIMMQSFISMGVVTILWFIIGFSLTFGPDVHGLVGGLKYMFLHGVGMEANPDYGSTIPFMSFFSYQQMFAILTPALITGAFADRVNFKSYLVFLVLWSLLIYWHTGYGAAVSCSRWESLTSQAGSLFTQVLVWLLWLPFSSLENVLLSVKRKWSRIM